MVMGQTLETILVVDDSRTQLHALQKLLSAQGYRVVTALNGREALAIAHEVQPQLLISDIDMPIMNGYQLCQTVKQDAQLFRLPVILLTTLSRPENILRALDARADYYLTKPYDEKYLLTRIASLLAAQRAPVASEEDGIPARLDEREDALEVVVGGARHSVSAGRQQMLNLLLCTYEQTVAQNSTMTRVQNDLQGLNSELRRQARRLEASQANYRALLENSSDAMVVIDRGGVVRYVNSAAEDLFVRAREEFVGRPFDFLVVGGQNKEVDIERPSSLRRAKDDRTERVVAELRVVETEWEGEGAYMATLRDITERKRYEAQIAEQQKKLREANEALEKLATSDALTGLKNRRAFKERLADEMRRAARYQLPLSLLMLDVDKFKQFNDTFGHPAGDEVLKQFAKILQAGARGSDFAARYGGEEFVMLLPNTDAEAAKVLSERLRSAIEGASWPLREVTASGGVATSIPRGVGDESLQEESEYLLSEADKALYQSKADGRNRITAVEVDLGLWSVEHAQSP